MIEKFENWGAFLAIFSFWRKNERESDKDSRSVYTLH